MRAAVGRTTRAKGVNVAYARNRVGVTIIMPKDQFERLKAIALKNCRSLTAECLFRVLQSLEAEGK